MASERGTSPSLVSEPSTVLAGIFLGLFGLTSLLHSFQAVKTRTWFLLPLLIGSYCEVAGFAARLFVASTYPHPSAVPTLLSTLLPLIAPTLIIASLFVELGYIMQMCKAEKLSFIRPTPLTVILLIGNGLVFIAQLLGTVLSVLQARTVQTARIGQYLNIAASIVQLTLLIFFLITTFVFDMRYVGYSRQMRFNERLPWERHIKALYFSTSILILRCIVHLVVYIAARDSAVLALLTGSEWPVYAFDAGPLVIALLVLNWVHPSEIGSSLKHTGLICMRLFHYEKPMPPAKFTSLEPPERAGFKTRIGTLHPELTESMVQLLPASRPQSRPGSRAGSRSGSRAPSRSATRTSVGSTNWTPSRYESRYESRAPSRSHNRSPSFTISRPSSRATSRPSSISNSRMSWQTLGGSTVGESLWLGERDMPPMPTLFPPRAQLALVELPVPPVPKIVYPKPHPDMAGPYYASPAYR